MENIVFVNMAHLPLDDRTFYHQAAALLSRGFSVVVISSKQAMKGEVGGIYIDSFDDACLTQCEKVIEIRKRLKCYKPVVIVCDTPLAVVAASKCKKTSVVYDVTEWYPSKKNLNGLKGLMRLAKALTLLLLNVVASLIADKFIFGEYYKARPFKSLFWKKKLEVPYYLDLKYIRQYPLKEFSQGIDLLYSGPFNEDKGMFNVLYVAEGVAMRLPKQQVTLKLICSAGTQSDECRYADWLKKIPNNLQINRIGYLPFEDYCYNIGNCHFFFDLRQIDVENTHCLPIKLFYYLACGRPVIYSDLKAIRKEIDEIDFGYLVDPDDIESICRFIIDCVNQPDLYLKYAQNARRAAEEKYNWKMLENKFVEFVLQ